MAPMDETSLNFGVDKEATAVLLEFLPAQAAIVPASLAFTEERMQRLQEKCKLTPLRQPPVEAKATVASARSEKLPRRQFLEVESGDRRSLATILKEIEKEFAEEILTALPVPPSIPAIAPAAAAASGPALPTPDFHGYQGYSGPAPHGIGFSAVAHLPGADGQGVTVIDLEGGWVLSHEALAAVQFNLWSGEPSTLSGWKEHGTAVGSLLFAERDGAGISGLAAGARGALASIYSGSPKRQQVAQQIDACRDLLNAGDVLLLEVQRPGPATEFQSSPQQTGYLPTSFWPDVKESIRDCIAKGICVVEVAGNGGVDLDDPELQGAFSQEGSTVTTLGPEDSGSIMVGAGHAPWRGDQARSPLSFSNYGARLDCQGWGEGVICAGYGEIWGSPGGDNSYTGNFYGTSSAAPMIAAAVAVVQSRHIHKFGQPASPLLVRQAFASFGSAQPTQAADDSGDDDRVRHIGPLPDLVAIFNALNLF